MLNDPSPHIRHRAGQCIVSSNSSWWYLIYREFLNTWVNFCGGREGWILWEIQIMLETGISWLSEVVSCQDVTWILNITSHQPSYGSWKKTSLLNFFGRSVKIGIHSWLFFALIHLFMALFFGDSVKIAICSWIFPFLLPGTKYFEHAGSRAAIPQF